MTSSHPPLFSIVTVCLNPGKDLPKTVESVLTQDYSDFEYVIKDGLSQDETREFHCADPRVTFVSQPDGGIYDAMNQALVLCSGRYVNFVNAGDTFRGRNVLSEVASIVLDRGYPDILYVDRYNEKLDIVTRYPTLLKPWYLFRRPVCHQALFVKRDVLQRLGGFNTTFRILADYDALMRLILVERATYVHCPMVGVNYRDGGVSSASRSRKQLMDELRRIRQTYFTRTQQVLYGTIWKSTLPGIRARLVRQDKVKWLRKVLGH